LGSNTESFLYILINSHSWHYYSDSSSKQADIQIHHVEYLYHTADGASVDRDLSMTGIDGALLVTEMGLLGEIHEDLAAGFHPIILVCFNHITEGHNPLPTSIPAIVVIEFVLKIF